MGTLVIYKQLNYIQSKDLGYNKDQVLTIENTYTLGDQAKAFKNSVLQMTGVQSGTLSSFLPVTNSSRNDNTYFQEAHALDINESIDMQTWRVDYDYFKTLGMQIIKGRAFSPDYGGDSSPLSSMKRRQQFLGYADPIGKKIYNIGTIQEDRWLYDHRCGEKFQF